MDTVEKIDFFSPAHRANPYRDYAYLRENAPVYRYTDSSGYAYWVITRYEDVQAAFKDPRLVKDYRHAYSQERIAQIEAQMTTREWRILDQNLLSADPPDHTRLRNLVSKAFTPRRMEQLRPRIQQIADELIDAMAGQSQVDLLDVYAFPLPFQVIAELLGVPTVDRDKFRSWSKSLLDGSGPDAPEVNSYKAAVAFVAYIEEMIAERRKTGGQEDLVGALVQAEESGDKLSEDELIAMIWLLIIAGHETTVNLIGNGMVALLRHPDQMAKLQTDLPGLIKPAIEEFLRYDGSVETSTIRFASEDVQISGQHIARGERVLLVIAGADHDATRFTNSDELDVTRANNQHIAFGYGIHFCLGAPLARLEGQIALSTLLERKPNIKLAVKPEDLQWRPSLLLRGLQSLPVLI